MKQPIGDGGAEALERSVRALLGHERHGLAHLPVVDRVLEPVSEGRVGLPNVHAHVDHQPLTDLALRLADAVVGEQRQAGDLDRHEGLGARLVVADVKAFLEERLDFAVGQGVPEARVALDPGIGFGKTVDHNLTLLRRLEEIAAIGRPVVIGTSRKSFLGRITGRDVTERGPATLATCVVAYLNGARTFRVHEVAPTRDALLVTAATVTGRWSSTTTAR